MQGEYPLCWPETWPRARVRSRARFEPTSIDKSRRFLQEELRMLGADVDGAVITSNVRLRIDGLPRSDQANPFDPGVSVFFQLDKRNTVLACDAWDLVEHNARAIALHIGAVRAQARYRVGTLAQAFSAYQALEAKASPAGYLSVLGLRADVELSRELVEGRYRELAKSRHPDTGGTRDEWIALAQAREDALAALERLGGDRA